MDDLDDNVKLSDVGLNDQLQWTFAPRKTPAEKNAEIARERRRRYQKRYVVQPEFDENSGYVSDDIGASFGEVRADGRRPGHRNRDIDRVMDNLRRLAPSLHHDQSLASFGPVGSADGPDMHAALDLIRLDRARRIAFGYTKPPPMSMLVGEDGGIDTMPFRQRRPRPDDIGRTNAGHFDGSLPRSRGTAGTECLPLEANQFEINGSVKGHQTRKQDANGKRNEGSLPGGQSRKRKQVGTQDQHGESVQSEEVAEPSSSPSPMPGLLSTRNKRQRTAAEWMLRQPAESAVHAALLHAPDIHY